jgi:hypothetical protein
LNRRFTFSDPAIIQALKTEFVPVSGDCKEFQKGHSHTSEWFISMVKHANSPELKEQLKIRGGGNGDTAQGLYIVGADGKYYGFMNDNDAKEVLSFLVAGRSSFVKDAPSPVDISADELAEPFSDRPPTDASVVRVFTRIRPVPAGSDTLNEGVGRDHLWILAKEVEEIAEHGSDVVGGEHSSFPLPSSLVARLVRFHFVDNVRGEPDTWNDDEVKQAVFSAKMISDSGTIKSFKFHGDFSAQTANHKRGIIGSVDGAFKITGSDQISKFGAFAQAQAWGRSRFTPGEPKGRFPLVVAMIETSDEISRVVPPEALYPGHEYLHANLSCLTSQE